MVLGRPISAGGRPSRPRSRGGAQQQTLAPPILGDADILNREVALNGQRYTVVGVAPAGFYGVDRGMVPEFWVPLSMAEEIMPDLVRPEKTATSATTNG